MSVHARGTFPRRPSTGATSDGLVITKATHLVAAGLIAAETEGQIITIALGSGAGLECFKDNVCHPLGLEMVIIGWRTKV
jgi:hypothetical protein